MIVVFFYKINDIMYHGKYIGKIGGYYEGLDIEIRDLCYPIWKETYSLNSEENVWVGIISSQRESTDYFSENEKNVFHTLYCNWSNQPVEIFMNGNQWKHKD